MEETLFPKSIKDNITKPLAIRLRPRNLEEIEGQEHILGKGKLLRRAIESDRLTSVIFYGPPGTGKTALGYCIANITKAHFERINAVTSGVQELRNIVESAKKRLEISRRRTILFIDEIHRFNKAQQDALLPSVEEGEITLIGATTHNPFFALTSPLLSRSQIFEFKLLNEESIKRIIKRALKDEERGLGRYRIKIDKRAIEFIAKISEGDARRALNALEIGVLTTPPSEDGFIHYTLEVAEESIQRKYIPYDRDEDEHYDTISAFIKSLRGSDPDAALYWLAKMLEGGEDPRFIARRMVIFAAEDIGNADPQALLVAVSAFQAQEFVGMPEAKIPLAQAVTYLATAPKSNASYKAIVSAEEEVKKEHTQQVPSHLRVGTYQGAKTLKRGEGYKYPHDYPEHFVVQKYLEVTKEFYHPSEEGFEKIIKERLQKWRKKKESENG
ncbi:replication-associated recombination protein A [Candidatus Calescamantes bacterium]|nr:replication-associated recombination protein A [Candidatus Calescamantes bacterium]